VALTATATAPPATTEVPARLAWWAPRTWTRGDRRALAVLAAVPVFLFVLPALAGHPAVVGDNLLQNYPLRVLVGRDLDAGHWPLWNPYAFSGTPLLGGMNAGAAYPGTLLFAVVPGPLAWVANLLVVSWAAAAGTFFLARSLGASPLASGLGAAVYAFSGAMVGQLVHVGLVQGQSWLPWIVLSQLALGRAVLDATGSWRATARRAAPAVLGLAALVGLVCLTGEPRALADAEVLVVVIAVVELCVHGSAATATPRGRLAYVAATVLGVAWGLGLGLVQLAPGWAFVRLSERHHVTYAFFSEGSWPTAWLPLLTAPGLLGGNGLLGTPAYFASYNLPEVTGAVGLTAVTALFAALAQLASRRPTAPVRRLAPFAALGVVGVLLALGASTPLGRVVHDLPVLGQLRLQNRSIVLFDLGAAVLLAWWLDAVVAGRRDEAALAGQRRVVTLAPLWATAALCALAVVDPGLVAEHVLRAPGTAAAAGGVRGLAAVTLVICVAYLWVLARPARSGRSSRGRAARALVVVVLCELVAFNVFFETGLFSGVTTFQPSPAAAAATFTTWRTAIVDPHVDVYHQGILLGMANLDVFTRYPSVQGYGSLESARYAAATGTQRLGALDGCALERGVLRPLELTALAVASSALVVSVHRDGAPTTCGRVVSRSAATRWVGTPTHVDRVVFAPPRDASLAGRDARVTLFGADGSPLHVRSRLTRAGADLVARFPSHPLAAAVRLSTPGGVRLAWTTWQPPSGRALRLDTAMQVALADGEFAFRGVSGRLAVFHRVGLSSSLQLYRTVGRYQGVVVPGRPREDGAATVEVAGSAPTTLLRSEAWLPGWTATLTPTDGAASRTAPVVPHGLIQAVAVPAGRWRVTFRYDAPDAAVGALASTVALAALLAAGVALALVARRARQVAAVAREGLG
jgi:hypothetical protein